MPPRKKVEVSDVTSVTPDDLLSFESVEEEKSSEGETEVETTEESLTEEDLEIARLKEELARVPDIPKPESELTPKQKEIRELQDQLARKRSESVVVSSEPVSRDGVLIHFIEDGFTVQGRTWVRGQQVSFGPRAYEQTKDRFGNSWIDLDEDAQEERYGKVFFLPGPWRGRKYADPEAQAKADAASTAAPIISF